MRQDGGNEFVGALWKRAMLSLEDPQEAERIFASLADGGWTQMPLQESFWAVRFGMVTDRFGIPWMVNCGKPA